MFHGDHAREERAAHVAAARRALRLTQAEIAEAMGVGVRTVHRWERGFCRPDDRTMRKLVAHLDAIDPGVAAELNRAIGGPPKPVPPPPSRAALDALVIDVANTLDISPNRARGALATFLEGLRAEKFSVEQAALGLSTSPL